MASQKTELDCQITQEINNEEVLEPTVDPMLLEHMKQEAKQEIAEEGHGTQHFSIIATSPVASQSIKPKIEDDENDILKAHGSSLQGLKKRILDPEISVPQEPSGSQSSSQQKEIASFALSQDEVWETAQKLKTFTGEELLRVLIIIHQHGQLPSDAPGTVDVFALEPNCQRDVYQYVEREWMRKLRDVDLLPPILPEDDDDEDDVTEKGVGI